MKLYTAITAFAMFTAVGACAPTSSPEAPVALASASSERTCFFVDQVRSFRSADDTSILLDTGRGRVYQADSAGFCQDMDFAQSIAIRPLSSGTNRICAGDYANLMVRNAGTGMGPCRVRIIKALNEQEIEAFGKLTE